MRSMSRRCHAAILAMALLVSNSFSHPGQVDDDGCHVESATGQRHCHPQRASAARATRRTPPQSGDEGVFFGPFAGISDGDTFFAKVQGVVMEFRLSDIDAPEYDQPYGSRSRDELKSLIAGRQLVLVYEDVDRYGRVVAHVWADDINVGREMIRRGAAWFYARYARDNSLFEVEEEARDAKRGLWALQLNDRIEPWVWREHKRTRQDPGAAAKDRKKE